MKPDRTMMVVIVGEQGRPNIGNMAGEYQTDCRKKKCLKQLKIENHEERKKEKYVQKWINKYR